MAAIIIPARFESSRFPGKPLVPLRGATSEPKTLVHRCVEAARLVRGVDRLVVATDDRRIAVEAERIGVEAVMTSSECRNGTERVAEAAVKLGLDTLVVNFQGDAPLTPPWFAEALIEVMTSDETIMMATPALRTDPMSLRNFIEDRAAGRVGATTVVAALSGDALYFSKEVIPYTGNRRTSDGSTPVFHHVGLYAYRPEALEAYAGWSPTPLETAESLEQLRFLEVGWRVRTVEVDARGRHFWEVNNPEDIPRVEAELAALGIA